METERTERTDRSSLSLLTPRPELEGANYIPGIDLERERKGDIKSDSMTYQSTVNSSFDSYPKGLDKGIEKGIDKGLEKGLEKGIEKGTYIVPCWILINLFHNSLPEGDVPSGTATTSMKARTIRTYTLKSTFFVFLYFCSFNPIRSYT